MIRDSSIKIEGMVHAAVIGIEVEALFAEEQKSVEVRATLVTDWFGRDRDDGVKGRLPGLPIPTRCQSRICRP